MGVLKILATLRRRFAQQRELARAGDDNQTARRCRFETMEERRMLSADPLLVGAVYIEEDLGSDLHGDTFEISFEGGVADTQLTRIVIDGDQQAAGFGLGDVFFDTLGTSFGADNAFPWTIVSQTGIDNVSATVVDGTSLLVIDFQGFHAGEKLVFSVDVDEVQSYDPTETDLTIINQDFDPITSGVEFQGSQFQAFFESPHFQNVDGQAEFRNIYDVGSQLDLSPDNIGGKRDRTAGAVMQLQQLPLPVTISGTVYHDKDLDLTQDATDPAIAGVTLSLWKKDNGGVYQDTLITTTTNVNGDYLFDVSLNLQPGTYRVVETQPSGFDFSVGAVPGTVAGGAVGSTVTGDPDVLTEITIPLGGQHAIDYDFAEALGAKISGYVYHDRDDDGVRETGEEGIAGVEVQVVPISTIAPQSTQSVLTDANGYYEVGGLSPGTYDVVEVAQPIGYLDGKDTAGTVAAVASGTALDERIAAVVLPEGSTGVEYNFGELLPGSISGFVHSDPNRNCVFETSETPIQGVVVELLDSQGNLIATTQTDAQGYYQFDGLAPGEYSVAELQPSGYFHGGQVVGSGSGDASVDDLVSNVAIGSGENLVDYNFCEVPPSSISGFVFQDGLAIPTLNGQPPADLSTVRDGQQTPDDTPIAGVVLQLRDGITGDVITASQALPGYYATGPITTTTDAAGFYQFLGLSEGNYAVFEIHPAGFFDGIDTPGTTSGIAVNAHQPLGVSVLSNLIVDPLNDAILNIKIGVDEHSRLNNFSEVQAFPPPPVDEPPDDPPPPPPSVVAAPPPIVQPLLIPPPVAVPPLVIDGGGGLIELTWHLSVVDAGRPRADRSISISDASLWHTVAHNSLWDGAQFDEGRWTLRLNDAQRDAEAETREFVFGIHGGIPVVGDFNGDGVDEIAIFYQGQWFLDVNGNGRWDENDLWAELGDQNDLPVIGDWDADGKDDIGIFGPAWSGDSRAIQAEPGLPDSHNAYFGKPKNMPPKPEEATDGHRLMRLTAKGTPRADLIDHVFRYGRNGDMPLAGDWNGDGVSAIGIFRDGNWRFDTDGDGRLTSADRTAHFGQAGDLPVVGDFNGDGVDEIGVFRAGTWMIDVNGNRELDAHDKVFEMGGAADLPIVGDFDGDGTDQFGLYRELAPEGPRQARR